MRGMRWPERSGVAVRCRKVLLDMGVYAFVERDLNNADRVNAFLPLDVVNQLRVFAANVTAFLQFQSPSGAPL